MPKSSEKFGNRGMRLNKGRGCLVGLTLGRFWPLAPLALTPTVPPVTPRGGGGATIDDCCEAALKLGGGRGGLGGPGGKGAWGGRSGPPGRPRPPMAVVGPLNGLPLVFWGLGMIVDVKMVGFPAFWLLFNGGGKLDSGRSCSLETPPEVPLPTPGVAELEIVSPKLLMPAPMLPKKPGACRVSDSMKKFWWGGLACWPLGLPSGFRAFKTNEHWVLQMLSLLTAS